MAELEKDLDFATWTSELDGIINKVDKDLEVPSTISMNLWKEDLVLRRVVDGPMQLDLIGLSRISIGRQTLFYDFSKVEVVIDDAERTVFQLGVVHQVRH